MRKLATSIYRSTRPVNNRVAVGQLKDSLRESIGEGSRSSRRLFNAFETRALWDMPNNKLYELFEPASFCKKKPEGFGKFDRENRGKEGPATERQKEEESKKEKESPTDTEDSKKENDSKFDFKKTFGGNGKTPPQKKGFWFYVVMGFVGYGALKVLLKLGDTPVPNLSYKVRNR
jgi:hypothetical protein